MITAFSPFGRGECKKAVETSKVAISIESLAAMASRVRKASSDGVVALRPSDEAVLPLATSCTTHRARTASFPFTTLGPSTHRVGMILIPCFLANACASSADTILPALCESMLLSSVRRPSIADETSNGHPSSSDNALFIFANQTLDPHTCTCSGNTVFFSIRTAFTTLASFGASSSPTALVKPSGASNLE